MKRRIYSLIALAAYLAMTLTGFIVGIGAILESQSGASEGAGVGGSIVGVILALVGIVAVAYGSFALIPTLFKLCDTIFRKRALTVSCIVFDILLLLISVLLFIGTMLEPSEAIVGIAAFCALPIITLVFNSLCLHTDA